MSAPASRQLFWDEEFAWDVPLPAEPAPAPPAPPPPRRRRRRAVSVRFVTRVGALASAAVTLAAALIVGTLLPREPAAEERPAARPATSPPAANVSPEKVELLQLGDRGQRVRGVQVALAVLRLDTGTADGVFEGRTRDAVLAFQQAHGLQTDGVVGPATAEALQDALVGEAARAGAKARRGLRAAVAAGRVSARTGARYDEIVTGSLTRLAEMPFTEAAYLALVLEQVAGHAARYDEPRSLALFGMVEANAEHLAETSLPREPGDLTGADGVVYRFAPTRGFQFHPLAEFAALNAHVTRRRTEEAARLAKALVARAVPEGDTLVWEYYFPYGGPAPWRSGFVQAVAAEALARTSTETGDESLRVAASAAFRAIPDRLAVETAGGGWILEYAFSDMLILNAQLQSLVSLRRYVATTGDLEARAFAGQLETASRALLSRFDTGCWSLYSLGGAPASPHYHRYHVSLLEKLAATTREAPWGEVARRWSGGCS